MSFNQLLVDQPQPEIARSAVVLGEVHVGAGAILAQGLVVRSHGAAVSIGNYSAVLENGVVIGTPAHPVRVGQRTVFGHRATIVGATIGDLCEIGNGAILMPGSRLGNGCILGEGTLVPPGTVIPAGSVLVGRPPHVIRSATDADRERLAVLRQHQTNLTDHPGTIVPGPMRAGERMGTLYAYRDKTPSIGAGTLLSQTIAPGSMTLPRPMWQPWIIAPGPITASSSMISSLSGSRCSTVFSRICTREPTRTGPWESPMIFTPAPMSEASPMTTSPVISAESNSRVPAPIDGVLSR